MQDELVLVYTTTLTGTVKIEDPMKRVGESKITPTPELETTLLASAPIRARLAKGKMELGGLTQGDDYLPQKPLTPEFQRILQHGRRNIHVHLTPYYIPLLKGLREIPPLRPNTKQQV
ncbi:hypothetical protein F2Q68_00007669 [Brassica cretica]|uniref:Uncharacterized protein n=1 Tax=Brassica cretica TaxID=69181 RepID=A0A8S9L5X1_BRACR|nr:hypothetical protein F2Q68_00007669 [Brassica cretica]